MSFTSVLKTLWSNVRPLGRTRDVYACFTQRDTLYGRRIQHDWQRIPFWHPSRWADGNGYRCQNCGVVRDAYPTFVSAWGFLIWRIVLFALAINGLLALLLGVR